MKNFLSLEDLTTNEIMEMIETALQFKNGMDFNLNGKIIANLFFESSTRTQYSFNTAEEKLGMKVISFNPASSSLNKGESFYDTIKTFESFGVDALVIRHSENEYYKQFKKLNCAIINAGDGTGNHPSQSLLDLVTIYEEYKHFAGLKIAIIGDIKHSRVAHGNVKVMNRLGMKCFISGPDFYKDDTAEYIPIDDAVKNMDIIMMLRVQNERHEKMQLSNNEYLQSYGLTEERVKMMKDNAIIMHPAPFNRGVEIEDSVVECDKSRIFKQITNGVYARMSILKRSLE